MLPEDINDLTQQELVDLLVKQTTLLLDAMMQKGFDKGRMRNIRRDVQSLQSAILSKRVLNNHKSINPSILTHT